MTRALLVAAAVLSGVLSLAATASAVPIPGPFDGPLPRFTGAATSAQPLFGPYPRQNPALAENGRSGSGLAAGNGGYSPFAGPLGKGTTRASTLNMGGCASLAFDARGRIVAVCNSPLAPSLLLFDPKTIASIATMQLPQRSGFEPAALLALNITDFTGGTHFVMRADGTLLVPTNNGRLLHIAVDPGGFRQLGLIDLKGVLAAASERLFAVGAGFDGYDWAAGNKGTVVAVPRGGGPPRAIYLKEPIAEDIATDTTGTYVVTSEALYRLKVTSDGTPRVVWREPLPQGLTDSHSGRIHLGSGTPPVVLAHGLVAVADSVNPPRVVVMRISGPESGRLRCTVPVFNAGSGSVEAQLVAAGRSLVVMNAYGYDNLTTTELGRTSTGGMARIVVGKKGCRTAWTNTLVSPSAQAVVSRKTGLLYTTVKPKGLPDYWGLGAIDWRTGKQRFSVLAGEGLGFNSNGGAVVLGPDGTAYAGTFGGIVRWADK